MPYLLTQCNSVLTTECLWFAQQRMSCMHYAKLSNEFLAQMYTSWPKSFGPCGSLRYILEDSNKKRLVHFMRVFDCELRYAQTMHPFISWVWFHDKLQLLWSNKSVWARYRTFHRSLCMTARSAWAGGFCSLLQNQPTPAKVLSVCIATLHGFKKAFVYLWYTEG